MNCIIKFWKNVKYLNDICRVWTKPLFFFIHILAHSHCANYNAKYNHFIIKII